MQEPVYSHERWHAIIEKTVAEVQKLGELKGGEYAGDQDRLANFRRNGAQIGQPMEVCWAIYYNKHHDAVMQFIRDLVTGKQRERLEGIEGRVDDMITYLLLFKCMLDERANPQKMTEAQIIAKARELGILAEPLQQGTTTRTGSGPFGGSGSRVT